MPRPLRYFAAGTVSSITDRCIGEQYLLLPDDPAIKTLVESVWARALGRFPVDLLVLTVMSNHWHAKLRNRTDDYTAIPRFMQYVKSRVATGVNRIRGRQGTFWSGRYGAIEVVDEPSVVGGIVYALNNPVKAGLCETAAEWPGLSTLEATTGAPAACGRIEVPVSLPTGWEVLDEGQRADKLRAIDDQLRARESAIAKTRRANGLKRPDVRRKIASVTPTTRPESPARGRAPLVFAATEAARRAYRVTRRERQHLYRSASDAFRAGDLHAVFPAGMYRPRFDGPASAAPR